MIWYCRVDEYFHMKQCICTCPGVAEGWLPSLTEDISQTILISYLVVRSPLGRNWGWKGNTTKTSWPADKRQKENLLSWKQATTPHWFNKANSPDSISFSADMKSYWGLCSLSRSHKENLYEDRQNFPHAYSNSLWNLRGQNPSKQTPETQKWNSFPQRKHVRKKKKCPCFFWASLFVSLEFLSLMLI